MKVTWLDALNLALWWLFWGCLLFGYVKSRKPFGLKAKVNQGSE